METCLCMNGRWVNTMGIMYMDTEAYEKSDIMVPWSTSIHINPDYPDCKLIDSRLRLMMPLVKFNKMDKKQLYKNYITTYCEIVNNNPTCVTAQYTACGFLPVGIEPECLCNYMNKDIILPNLRKFSIEYFMLPPASPVWTSYKPMAEMASSYDIWVNKMEASKVVHKPIHNISTIDLLEVLLS